LKKIGDAAFMKILEEKIPVKEFDAIIKIEKEMLSGKEKSPRQVFGCIR